MHSLDYVIVSSLSIVYTQWVFVLPYFVHLKDRMIGEGDDPSASSFPRYPRYEGMVQAKAESQKFHQHLPKWMIRTKVLMPSFAVFLPSPFLSPCPICSHLSSQSVNQYCESGHIYYSTNSEIWVAGLLWMHCSACMLSFLIVSFLHNLSQFNDHSPARGFF